MAQHEEMTRVCQGCGRTFTIPFAELDNLWNIGMSRPVFCTNECAMHGWDPQAVWMGNMRRQRAEAASSS